jgi:O-antigen/teichoic acid export membrane protein
MSLLFVPWSEPLGLPWARVRAAIVELWSYGFSRFGTAVGIMLLFALPALMAARSGDLGLGGVLAFSVTAVGAAGSAAGPIATVLLPLAARAVSGGSMARVTADFRFWTRLFMGGAVAGTVLVVYFGDAVMRFFVPAELAAYSNVFRVSLCALVPYAYYCMARPVVDGVSHKPYNAISTVCALLTFAFVWVLGSRLTDWPPGIAECVSLCAAMLVLAVRSWFFIRRALDVERP